MSAPLPWLTVWVTGASTGIGREIALQLAAQGATVAVSARTAGKLADLAGCRAYPCDVTSEQQMLETGRRIEGELGPIGLALFCAGTYKPLDPARFDTGNFSATIATNYMGVVHGLAAVLPAMQARRSGHVAWIASVAGFRGLPRAAAYGPSKAALINLAESLKPELERAGITVSVINPGFVETPLTAQNDFPMPFLMQPGAAARRAIAGLVTGSFDISFPARFTLILKTARILPYTAYFWLIRRFVLKG